MYIYKSIQIILTSRKSCLFDGQSLWVKKSNPDHDVTMGSWDGAEVAELIGLYILFRLTEVKKIFNKQDIGLFRDDGLAVIQGSGHVIDTKRKNAIKVFQEEGLKITCDVNIKKVCFLDVVFDLEANSYKPFHKINSKIQYVNKGSNHPLIVLNNIPLGINKRLSGISSNEKCFDDEREVFQSALSAAGYSHVLDFNTGKKTGRLKQFHCINRNQQNIPEINNINRRNIIYFNPPFNIYCSTNVGKLFRDLVDKHFGRGNYLSKIFNKNTLKISYSCLSNI